MDVKRSYYAVVPGFVRYDNNLVSGAKLLYGEITALCNEKGYCWATNEYFSKLYNVNKKTISRWLKGLSKAGYITMAFKNPSSDLKNVVRWIKLTENPKEILERTKMSLLYGQKCPDPQDKNVPENNTINNTIDKEELYKYNSSSRRFAKNEEVKTAEMPMVGSETGNLGKKFEPDSKPYKLAEFFEECIRFNEPKFPQSEQQRQRWAKDIDLMLRLDKVEADDIAAVIEWCQRDGFWRSNILSGKKLREKYPQLLMKMNQKWR